jgi:UDP-N-acetyl-D-glucosamine dehydrogenase
MGVVGLGYVGLPFAVESARSGYRTSGSTCRRVVDGVNRGESHIQDVAGDVVGAFVGEGLLEATTDMARLAECDASPSACRRRSPRPGTRT